MKGSGNLNYQFINRDAVACVMVVGVSVILWVCGCFCFSTTDRLPSSSLIEKGNLWHHVPYVRPRPDHLWTNNLKLGPVGVVYWNGPVFVFTFEFYLCCVPEGQHLLFVTLAHAVFNFTHFSIPNLYASIWHVSQLKAIGNFWTWKNNFNDFFQGWWLDLNTHYADCGTYLKLHQVVKVILKHPV